MDRNSTVPTLGGWAGGNFLPSNRKLVRFRRPLKWRVVKADAATRNYWHIEQGTEAD